MEWMKIDDDLYNVESVTIEFSSDQKFLISITSIREEEDKIIEIFDSGRSFVFETKDWKFTDARLKSWVLDMKCVNISIVARKGGQKSKMYERERIIDELLKNNSK